MLTQNIIKLILIIISINVNVEGILAQTPIIKLSDNGYKNIVYKESKKHSKLVFEDSAKIRKDLTEFFHKEKSFIKSTLHTGSEISNYISTLFIMNMDGSNIHIDLRPSNDFNFDLVCVYFLNTIFTRYKFNATKYKTKIGVYMVYNTKDKKFLVNIVEVSGKKYYPIYKTSNHHWEHHTKE